MSTQTKLRLSIALAAVAALVSVAATGATGTKAIQERHEAMERIKDSMGALGAMAKKKTPFDAEAVRTNAETIAAKLTEAAGLFPEGSETGDVETWAKAEIWSERENFDKMFQSAIEAAEKLQAVTEEKDFLPALGELGGNCKGCHEKYRRPEE